MIEAGTIPKNDFLARVAEWPTQPGIYVMRDVSNRILYVGKAKNLRNRVRSYFQDPDKLTPKTRVLVKKITDLEFQVTNTELEALLLECNLIKKHRPRYNIRLKDDKNFPYVVLDFTHPFPQLRITRRVVVSPDLKYFGPYSGSIRDITRFILKTFQIRDCTDSKFKNRTRPCLNYEIGTCTAPCVNLVTQEAYAAQIRAAVMFLQGKKQVLLSGLKEEMETASEKQEYEKAKIARDKIYSLQSLTEKQDAVLTNSQKDVDIVGKFESGDDIQWAVLFVRAGFLIGRRSDKTTVPAGDGEEALRSFLEQFYSVSLMPDEIWVMDDFAGREDLAAMFSAQASKQVNIHVKRGEKGMRLLGMAAENAKLIYQDAKRMKTDNATEQLQEVLGLVDAPHTIEGIDVSNLQGENPAVALVHFADERPLKSRYRLYYPKTIEGQNDFGMIQEVVHRRFSKLGENPPPDLLLIDGGKGQLNAALKALADLGQEIPILALAKSHVDRAFTRKEISKSEERIFLPNRKNPVILKENNPALRLLQQVRDEAHRFSVKSHRRRRDKAAIQSPLDAVEGVGPKVKEKLLKTFGDIETIAASTVEEIAAAGISRATAERLLVELNREDEGGASLDDADGAQAPDGEFE